VSRITQTSLALQRDVLESGFLLELFLRYPARIELWRTATPEVMRDVFKPGAVRKELASDRADRKTIYDSFCTYATHPTTKGSGLLTRDGFATTGPRLNQRHLQSCLGELTRNLPYFTVVSSQLLVEDIPSLKSDIDSLFGFLREWLPESLGFTPVAFDAADLAAWARLLWTSGQPPATTP
jgi:hypothetical protein